MRSIKTMMDFNFFYPWLNCSVINANFYFLPYDIRVIDFVEIFVQLDYYFFSL